MKPTSARMSIKPAQRLPEVIAPTAKADIGMYESDEVALKLGSVVKLPLQPKGLTLKLPEAATD